MKIFIAGGTGAIGRPLIAELLAKGHALEKYWYPTVPTCLVKNGGEYVALPLAASEEAKQKP